MDHVVFINNYEDYINLLNNNDIYRKFTIIFMENVFIPELILSSFNIIRLISIPSSSTTINLINCSLHGSVGNGYYNNSLYETFLPSRIEILNLSSNYISKIDITLCNNLKQVNICNNRISEFYIGNQPFLSFINCSKNKIQYLNLQACNSLKTFIASSNNLKQIYYP